MKYRLILAAVVVLAVVGAAVGWTILRSPPPQEGQPTAMRVAQTGDFLLYAGLYVALDTGIFERNGLDVSITNTGGDEKSAAAVLSGNAEVGIGDPTFAAIAKARGQELRVVSSLVAGAPFWGVTNNPEVAARYHATGLRGLRVATFPAPSTAYVLQQAMFQRAGIQPMIVQGAFGSLQGMLESGRADIALELEPNVSVVQARGATVLYSMDAENEDLAVTGAIVSASYAASNPDEVRAFCRSIGEAYAFMRSQPNQTEILLARRFPELPAPVISAALRRMLEAGIIPDSPKTDPAAWRRALELRASVGDISDVAVVEGVLDNRYCP